MNYRADIRAGMQSVIYVSLTARLSAAAILFDNFQCRISARNI